MQKAVSLGAKIAIAAAAVTALAYSFWPRPVYVDTVPASTQPMLVTVDEDGTTRIRERYVVSSPLPGRLRRITLDPGDTVLAGETVLARLEPTDPVLLDARALAEARGRVSAAEASVRRSEAAYDRASAAYDFAEKELGRVSTAFTSGAATRIELERVESEHRQAAGDLRAAEFEVDVASHELEVAQSALLFAQGGPHEEESHTQLPLFSPIDGVVLHVFQESVAVIDSGTPLVEVGDLNDLELVVDVLSTDAISIKPGQRVIVEQWGGDQPLNALVRHVEPSAFLKVSALGIEEHRVNVVADLVAPANERSGLGDKFRIEARIVVWESEAALVVPTSSLFRRDGEWAVFLLVGGTLELRTINVGRMNGRIAQVNSGIAEGESVVVYPSDQLHAGLRAEARR